MIPSSCNNASEAAHTSLQSRNGLALVNRKLTQSLVR